MLFVFDMDGTVVDSMSTLEELAIVTMTSCFAMSEKLAKYHYRATVGLPFGEQLQKIFKTQKSDVLANIAAATDRYQQHHLLLAPTFPLAPRALELLTWLRAQQIHTALVTSTARSIVNEMTQVKALPFSVINSYHDHRTKDIQILHACNLLHVPHYETTYFGDSPADAMFAKRAGVRYCYAEAARLCESVFRITGEPV